MSQAAVDALRAARNLLLDNMDDAVRAVVERKQRRYRSAWGVNVAEVCKLVETLGGKHLSTDSDEHTFKLGFLFGIILFCTCFLDFK